LPPYDPTRPDVDSPYEAASDEIEARLGDIWCFTLRLNSIGVNDNYFDIGGDSTLSMQLFSEIHRDFKIELLQATLFHAPTVRSMAQIIRSSGVQKVRSAIVPIQPEGDRPPVFCIAGADGQVVVFRRLALELGNEQPLYGLQPFGLGEYSPVLLYVDKIAAYYIHQIKAAGQGPLRCLIGYSFGGLIAIEMARQLRRSGEPVSAVVLIDTPNPANFELRDRIKRYRYYLGLDRLRQRFTKRYLATLYKVSTFVGVRPPYRTLSTFELQALALRTQKAKPYSGRVYLFRAAHGEAFLDSGPALGWEGMLSDLVLLEVPGDHITIAAGRNFKILSEELARCLLTLDKSS
jgi:thioesterase domain-containing protein